MKKSALLVAVIFPLLAFPSSVISSPGGQRKYLEILQRIHSEVKQLESYPGEDFLRGEFFIGNDDDDDTYKDIHVSILIQDYEGYEKMKIQVTEMEAVRENPRVKYARTSKTISCLFRNHNVEIESSDYQEREISALIKEILRAIQAKKKLLSLCGSGRRG